MQFCSYSFIEHTCKINAILCILKFIYIRCEITLEAEKVRKLSVVDCNDVKNFMAENWKNYRQSLAEIALLYSASYSQMDPKYNTKRFNWTLVNYG
jgi:hypothetical protein